MLESSTCAVSPPRALRFAVLCESVSLEAWHAKCLDLLLGSGCAQLVLLGTRSDFGQVGSITISVIRKSLKRPGEDSTTGPLPPSVSQFRGILLATLGSGHNAANPGVFRLCVRTTPPCAQVHLIFGLILPFVSDATELSISRPACLADRTDRKQHERSICPARPSCGPVADVGGRHGIIFTAWAAWVGESALKRPLVEKAAQHVAGDPRHVVAVGLVRECAAPGD